MKVVIIGIGTGGLFAGLTIKKRNRDVEVVYIDRKNYELLHPCGLPYALEGKVDSFEKLKSTLPDMGFTKFLSHEVLKINPVEKLVIAKNLDSGEEISENYDNLIIASGSSALIPPISGAKELHHKGVFTIDSFEETNQLSEFIKDKKDAFVIGAGAIGLETAFALKKRGLDVTIVEMLPSLLPKALDPDLSKIIEDYLKSCGINILLNSKLDEIKGNTNNDCQNVSAVVVNGSEQKADVVVLASGVRPCIDFLNETGIDVGKWGIKVNDKMQTNFPEIYAIGDCVQIKSLIDNRDWMMQLAVAAYKQGMVAGMNIVGFEKQYKGALTTFVTKVGELEIATTGFNSHFASENAVVGKINGLTKPDWCVGSEKITVKLIVDKDSKKIIGGQAIGKKGAGSRIDVVATAIKAGFTVYDLSESELTYCPEVSETYDVLMQAADNAIRKIER